MSGNRKTQVYTLQILHTYIAAGRRSIIVYYYMYVSSQYCMYMCIPVRIMSVLLLQHCLASSVHSVYRSHSFVSLHVFSCVFIRSSPSLLPQTAYHGFPKDATAMAFEPHYSLLYIGTKNGELRVYPPFLTTAYIIPLSSLPPSLPPTLTLSYNHP